MKMLEITHLVWYTILDMLFLTIKNLIVYVNMRMKYNAQMKEDYKYV